MVTLDLGLQVHNQVEPLLLGFLLGVEWQGKKPPGKGKMKGLGVPEPPRRGMPPTA